MRHFGVLFGGLLLLACAALAQQSPTNSDSAALEQKIRDLEDRLVRRR